MILDNDFFRFFFSLSNIDLNNNNYKIELESVIEHNSSLKIKWGLIKRFEHSSRGTISIKKIFRIQFRRGVVHKPLDWIFSHLASASPIRKSVGWWALSWFLNNYETKYKEICGRDPDLRSIPDLIWWMSENAVKKI